jgi:hypothetical protein
MNSRIIAMTQDGAILASLPVVAVTGWKVLKDSDLVSEAVAEMVRQGLLSASEAAASTVRLG